MCAARTSFPWDYERHGQVLALNAILQELDNIEHLLCKAARGPIWSKSPVQYGSPSETRLGRVQPGLKHAVQASKASHARVEPRVIV